MPSTIPYDPSLALTSVVSWSQISSLLAIGKLQAKADAAQDTLNAVLSARRSLDMTKSELLQLGIDVADLNKNIDTLNDEIKTAASEYCAEKINAEQQIKDYRKNKKEVDAQMESPVDYMKTQIKTMPLSNDSMNMDVQYFSMESNEQGSTGYSSKIADFVSSTTSFFGNTATTELRNSVQNQVAEQTSNHDISGTLVISVSCTHKNAAVLAPCVINVDKAIKVWNHYFKDDHLDVTSSKGMQQLANAVQDEDANRFSIISGTTFGSSFVGMVHILNSTNTNASQNMSSIASSIQAQMDAGAWFESASGGFGVNVDIANDVKNLLSTQNITSHVTCITMGAIPSMVANQVKMGVQEFADFDPKKNMEALATLQNNTISDQNSLSQSAAAARTGKQMVSMKESEVKAALSALSTIDSGSNKILDINSMMTALEDYLKQAANGQAGVPINYYIKDITKDMLAEMWIAKYMPGKYMTIQYDDDDEKNKGKDKSKDGEQS